MMPVAMSLTLPRSIRLQARWWLVVACLALFPGKGLVLSAQTAQPTAPPQTSGEGQHRTRLILKDGSYQIVMRYSVEGRIVRFVSAERGGAVEEIPASLVDLEATRKYEQAHATKPAEDEAQGRAPAIDPELLKEEADRASRTPEVAPDLRLDTEDAVLLLDTFQGTPELVPLAQTGGDLNKSTGHSVVKGVLNPRASPHQIVQIRGSRSPVQAHVDTPVLYLRLGDDTGAPTGSAPLVVDTHGSQANASTVASGGAATSRYVIVRADVRRDARDFLSFPTGALEARARRADDVVETAREILPGAHWLKLTPAETLGFGEYALMEVISDREVNLGVWDFGVHPTAPENRDSLRPEPSRPASLERRQQDQ